jgi:hypothetical protein
MQPPLHPAPEQLASSRGSRDRRNPTASPSTTSSRSDHGSDAGTEWTWAGEGPAGSAAAATTAAYGSANAGQGTSNSRRDRGPNRLPYAPDLPTNLPCTSLGGDRFCLGHRVQEQKSMQVQIALSCPNDSPQELSQEALICCYRASVQRPADSECSVELLDCVVALDHEEQLSVSCAASAMNGTIGAP